MYLREIMEDSLLPMMGSRDGGMFRNDGMFRDDGMFLRLVFSQHFTYPPNLVYTYIK